MKWNAAFRISSLAGIRIMLSCFEAILFVTTPRISVVYNNYSTYAYFSYKLAALGWLKLCSIYLFSQVAGLEYIHGIPFLVLGAGQNCWWDHTAALKMFALNWTLSFKLTEVCIYAGPSLTMWSVNFILSKKKDAEMLCMIWERI